MGSKLKELLNTEIKIGKDKYAHLIFGFLTAVFTFSYFKDQKRTLQEKISLTGAVGFMTWAGKEILDFYTPGHSVDILDLLFSCAGVSLCLVWLSITKKK